MRRVLFVLLGVLVVAVPARGQSLWIEKGDRGVEVSAGWSVGPDANGLETIFGMSLDGRTDVGIGLSRYTLDLGAFKSSWTEYAPYVKFFAVQEEDGAPVSLSLDAQLFVGNYDGDDSGRYLELGPTVYKALRVNDRFAIYPFAGFRFVAESYTFGGFNETARYLARDFGLHFTTPVNDRWFVRGTIEESSFRRETYRAARIALVGRL
jgi:hypothetical protein